MTFPSMAPPDLAATIVGHDARPAYQLTHDGQDLTARFQGRLISLTLVDNRGFEADQLDIELDDADGMLALPEKASACSWHSVGRIPAWWTRAATRSTKSSMRAHLTG